MKKFFSRFEATWALVYCALILTLMEYFFIPPRAEGWLSGPGLYTWKTPSLTAGLVWSASCLILYLIVPISIVKLNKLDTLKNFGWNLKGFFGHLKIYL